MKKGNNVSRNTSRASSHRAFRRWAKQLFASMMKRQDRTDSDNSLIHALLREIGELLEDFASELARQSKGGKR